MTTLFKIKALKKHLHLAYPLLAAGTTQVFAVAGFIIAARWLLPADLGAWAMFLTLVSFLEMARIGLIQSALVHFMAHSEQDEHPRIRLAALLLSSGISLVAAILLAVVGSLLNIIWHLNGLSTLLWWFVGVAMVTAPLRWQDVVRTQAQDFKGIFQTATVYGLSYLAPLLVLNYMGIKTGLVGLLLLQIPASLLTLLFSRSILTRDWSWQVLKDGKLLKWFFEILKFGRYGLGSNLCSMFFQRADVLLLAAFVTPAGLAGYNVATRIVNWLDFPLNALSQSFAPKIAIAHHQDGIVGVDHTYSRAVKLLLIAGLPLSIGSFFIAETMVRLLAGDAFSGSAGLLQILLLANLAKPFGRMLGVVLDATGRPSANFKMVVLSLAANLILLMVLVPGFGTIGAAIASTTGIFLTTIAGQWAFKTRKIWSLSLR